MTVYVDQLQLRRPKSARAARYGTQWCHLFADSLEELEDFAVQKLGLKAEYLHRSSVPHIDLTPNKRKLAIKLGALKVQTKEYLLRQRLSAAGLVTEPAVIPRLYVAKYKTPNV